MAIQQCESCRGTKRVKGLGMLEHTCSACNGIGWTDVKPKETTDDVVKNKDGSIVEIKRRGRKPKVQEEYA